MESHDRLTESVKSKELCENKTVCVLILILLLLGAILIVWRVAKIRPKKEDKAQFYDVRHIST